MPRLRPVVGWVALVLAVGGAAGCAATESGTEKPLVDKHFTELLGRPDILAAEATHQRMLAAIRDAVAAELSLAPWRVEANPADAVTGSACGGDYAALGPDGEVRRYRAGTSPGNLADADWPRAVAVVARTAAGFGFGAPTVVVDRPGDHEVSLRDGTGAELIFGTAQNTILSLSTGCHLTAEAHRRGVPRAEEPLY